MRRLLLFLLFLAAAAAPAGAAITFNAGAPMTTDASFTASQPSYGGGIILHVGGTFDGASVALQVSSWSISGTPVWITADTCDTMTAAQVCRAAVGPADLRLTITGAGGSTSITAVGYEVQAVVASTGAGGLTSPITEAVIIDTGGSLSVSGSGTITATAVPWTGVTSPPILTASPDYSIEPPAVGGALIVRQPGGIAGTDDIRIYHDGGHGYLKSLSGRLELWGAPAGQTWIYGENVVGLKVAAGSVDLVGCKTFGKLSAAPSGAACDTYYDTDINKICVYNGTGWVQVDDSTTGCA